MSQALRIEPRPAFAQRPDRKPRALFVALADSVGPERVIGALAIHGVSCALLSPPGFWATRTDHLSRRFGLPARIGPHLSAMFVRPRLERIQRAWSPDIIIPLDDLSSALLSELTFTPGLPAELAATLRASIGGARPAPRTRSDAMRLAASLGVRTPENRAVDDVETAAVMADAWGYPVVLKRDHTCGGAGVVIVNDREHLTEAFEALTADRRRARLKRKVKRLAWRIARAPHLAEGRISLQQHVAGRPAMRVVAALNGRVLDGVSFVAERNYPPVTGASTMVAHLENAEMDEACRRLVAALGSSGFVSFDFMVDEARGHARLIEINARPIGTAHLGGWFGHDVCAALAGALGAVTAPSRIRLSPRSVALFPKELIRNPSFLDDAGDDLVFHDVPRADPALLKSYMDHLARHGVIAKTRRRGKLGGRRGLGHAFPGVTTEVIAAKFDNRQARSE